MIICNQCGASLKEGAHFCNECGAAVPGTQPLGTSTLEETLVRPPVQGQPTHNVVNTQPLPPGRPPRASVAVPLVVLGVILGGGFLLLLGITASRSNNYNSYNSNNTSANTGGYNYNSANSNNRSANYSTNTGNINSNRGNVNSGNNTNTGGYNSSSPPTPRSGFDYVEGKILNNSYISASDLNGLSLWQLRLLRNTVFAKYGRTYPKPEDWSMQQHFNSRPWYSPNDNYNSNQQYVSLSSADEANLSVIKQAEFENSP